MAKKKKLKCGVCGKPAIAVVASIFGAISYATCIECANAGREPWTHLVGGLVGCKRGQLIDGIQEFIDATCKYYNKTEDDLWNEIEQLCKDYEEYMKRDKLDSKI